MTSLIQILRPDSLSVPLRLCASVLKASTVPLLSWALILQATAYAADPVETDVFNAGQEGYHSFRIPALIVTKNGSLLAICEGRKTGRGDHGDLVDILVLLDGIIDIVN